MGVTECAARKSYAGRQETLEKDVVRSLTAIQSKFEAHMMATSPEPDIAQLGDMIVTLVNKVGAVCRFHASSTHLANQLHDTTDTLEKERHRRRKFRYCESLVNVRIIRHLNENTSQEARAEDAMWEVLQPYVEQLDKARRKLEEGERSHQERMQDMEQAHNAIAAAQLQERHQKALRAKFTELQSGATKTLQLVADLAVQLGAEREKAQQLRKEARQLQAERVEKIAKRQEAGLFRGIDDKLAHALRLFLSDTAKDMVLVPKDQLDKLGSGGSGEGANTGLDRKDSSAIEMPTGSTGAAVAVAEADDNDILDIKHSVEAANEEERAEVIAQLAARSDITAADIARVDRDIQRKNDFAKKLLEEAQRTSEEKMQRELAAAAGDEKTRRELAEAQARLETLKKKQAEEERRLEQKLQAEQQKAMEEELRKREEDEKRILEQRQQITQQMQEGSADDGERTSVMKEHQVWQSALTNVTAHARFRFSCPS